jgi:large subunit ribosomal protein L17
VRHRVAGRQFGRTTNQRKALFRGLATSLFSHLKIETTVAKAKETKKLAERIITLGKRGDLHSRRLALSRLPNKKIIARLFKDIAPKLDGRQSGYLRIVRTRVRSGDNASLAVLEFVDYDALIEKKEEKEEKKKPKKEDKKQPPAS